MIGLSDTIIIVGVAGGIIATAVGVQGYRQWVAVKRAEWLWNLYREFYMESKMKTIREMLDDYKGRKKIERMIKEKNSRLSSDFTDYLNFFEFMVYLREMGALKEKDIVAMFDYYLRCIVSISNIFTFLDEEGYEYLKKYLESNYLNFFVYGTLKKISVFSKVIDGGQVEYVGKGKICAKLYDLGEYPGAVESKSEKNIVYGKVFKITDANKLSLLDEYEEFNPDMPTGSLYIRKLSEITMEDGKKRFAFVYFYNKDISKARLISDGVWREPK